MRGAGFNETAVAAIRCTGVQRTGHVNRPRSHAAQQNNIARMVGDRACFDHAGVVDHTGQQRVFGSGAHQHQSAVSANDAAVFGQIVQHASVNLHFDQAVVLESQGGCAARSQCQGALRRTDVALVADAVAEQRYKAAGAVSTRGVDAAQVDHAARAIAAETAAVAAQTGVVQV